MGMIHSVFRHFLRLIIRILHVLLRLHFPHRPHIFAPIHYACIFDAFLLSWRRKLYSLRDCNRILFWHIGTDKHFEHVMLIRIHHIDPLVEADSVLIDFRKFQIDTFVPVDRNLLFVGNIRKLHGKRLTSGIHAIQADRNTALIHCVGITVFSIISLDLNHPLRKIRQRHFHRIDRIRILTKVRPWCTLIFRIFLTVPVLRRHDRYSFFTIPFHTDIQTVFSMILCAHPVKTSCKHGHPHHHDCRERHKEVFFWHPFPSFTSSRCHFQLLFHFLLYHYTHIIRHHRKFCFYIL